MATEGAERSADGALELGDEPAGAGAGAVAWPPVFGTPVTDGADGADGADGRLGAGAGAGTLGVGAGAGAWT